MDSFQSDKITWETPSFSDVYENAIKEVNQLLMQIESMENRPFYPK